MSVRATGAIVAELVVATGIPNSPRMIVQDFDAEKRTVSTVWFSDDNKAQHAVFPASALDRAPEEGTKKSARKTATPGAKGTKKK
ncbi:MAG: hypothetical protein LBG90_00790 [Spirochaetaceae bacterium]|jgi:hypothetical protein|nr:hypothetical protein [Spirochaetaceae bacterium]